MEYGYVVRVANKYGDFWLSQRVYLRYEDVIVVKHNVADTKRYDRVYVLLATKEQYETALSRKE